MKQAIGGCLGILAIVAVLTVLAFSAVTAVTRAFDSWQDSRAAVKVAQETTAQVQIHEVQETERARIEWNGRVRVAREQKQGEWAYTGLWAVQAFTLMCGVFFCIALYLALRRQASGVE